MSKRLQLNCAPEVPAASLANRATDAVRLGRFKDAIELLKRLIKQDPSPEWRNALADAYAGRARALAAKGMFKEAEIVLGNTAATDGTVREPLLHLQCLIRQGQFQKAGAHAFLYPPINQSARLAAGRCSYYVRSVGCEEHDMRLMMQGLTDAAFEQRFGAEDACLAALAAARQAAGMACPRCGNPKSYVYGRRVGCTRCNQRWSVTSGTVMADTKLPLTHWFRAMHLMTSTKQGISAIELGRRLGVSYPTAWYLHKRLRHAMTERGARHVLGAAPADGCARPTVEADDVYLGGERNQGRGTAGKTRVIAACERQADGAMGYVVMKVVASFSAEHVAAFRDAHIAHGAHIHTDGLRGFPAFADPATQRTHQVTVTASKRPDRARGSAFFWINTAIANLSTAIKATYKAPSPKHLPDYLGAFCWTTNHRKNMRGMISAACRAIATSTALTRKTVYAPPVGAIG